MRQVIHKQTREGLREPKSARGTETFGYWVTRGLWRWAKSQALVLPLTLV